MKKKKPRPIKEIIRSTWKKIKHAHSVAKVKVGRTTPLNQQEQEELKYLNQMDKENAKGKVRRATRKTKKLQQDKEKGQNISY